MLNKFSDHYPTNKKTQTHCEWHISHSSNALEINSSFVSRSHRHWHNMHLHTFRHKCERVQNQKIILATIPCKNSSTSAAFYAKNFSIHLQPLLFVLLFFMSTNRYDQISQLSRANFSF